ncbi:MAG: MFS transporter [Acidimicrobiia bacterium]
MIAAITVMMLVSALPFALTGPMASYIQDDLRFDDAVLGLVLGAHPLGLALTSLPAGYFIEHVGVARGLRACLLVTMCAAVVAAASTTWVALALSLFLCGCAGVLADMVSALWVSRAVPPARHGFTFGLRQAMSPASAMIGGVAVPAIAATMGWRWAFAGVAVGTLATGAFLRRMKPPVHARRKHDRGGDVKLSALMILGVSVCLAQTPVFFFIGFTVKAATSSGLSPTASGILFAASAALGIGCRVALGVFVDRSSKNVINVIISYLIVGSIGLAAISTGNSWVIVFACPLSFASLWAWQALVYVFILRTNKTAPAFAAAVMVVFFATGAFAGSVTFGAISNHSIRAAWLSAAAMPIIAIPWMVAARRHFGSA